MAVNIPPIQKIFVISAVALLRRNRKQKLRLTTQTKCHEVPSLQLCSINNNTGVNMTGLLDIEYLLKEVNDATIWSFVLWN